MAQLFDDRRLQADQQVTVPYNAAVQLPLVADLALGRKRELVLADLAQSLGSVAPDTPSQAVMTAGQAGSFAEEAFKAAVGDLHRSILNKLADDDQQIAAYQLGLALSDMCWLPSVEGGAESLMLMFQRGQVAALKSWLSSAGATIPAGSAATVGKSLENWQDWVEINAQRITAAWPDGQAGPILQALRIQSMAWHSVLVGDPQTSGAPSVNAWVQVGTSVIRAARAATLAALRRFWWLVTLAVIVIGVVLYFVVADPHLAGTSKVWASLAWITASVGVTGAGFRSAVGKAVSGVGAEVWVAAKADAVAWNVTWLPTLSLGARERRGLARAGVAMPAMRANLEAISAAATGPVKVALGPASSSLSPQASPE